jgi:hypothetical protein
MEYEPKSSTERPEWETVLPADFRPSSEWLHELPPQIFNLEQMDPDQVASLVIALNTTDERATAARDMENIDRFTGLLQRDLACLPARDVVKAREVYATLAAHSDPGVRGLVSDVMDSLLQFQPDDYAARQSVIDLWMTLLHDEDPNVREGVHWSMSRAVHSGWLDGLTARYLDSKLPGRWQREDWGDEQIGS